jgi:hypothetical protein
MSSFAVHTVHYTAIIKGTARIALPVGKRPEDYEHLLANHEVNWNLHSVCDREVSNVTYHTTLERPNGPFVLPATVSLLDVALDEPVPSDDTDDDSDGDVSGEIGRPF